MADNITLGSGTLYVAAYAGAVIPTDVTLEVESNILGLISGGASVEYKPKEMEVSDDSNAVFKRFIIGEDVTFKSGVLTWNATVLNKLCANGSYTDDSATHKRTLKIGTSGAQEMAKYVVRFVHTDSFGTTRITLVGTASSGFSLAYKPDKETIVDAEFKAVAHDSDGTKLIYEETYTAA